MTCRRKPRRGRRRIRRLRGRLMPPPGKPQPANEQFASLVGFLETSLDTAAAGSRARGSRGPASAQPPRIRQRREGSARTSTSTPRRCCRGMKRTTASTTSPRRCRSRRRSWTSTSAPPTRSPLRRSATRRRCLPPPTYTVEGGGTQRMHRDGLPFGTRGGTVVEHYFPADGEYQLTIADLAGALWVHDMEFENTIVAMLDGKEFYRTHVGGEAGPAGHRPEAGSGGRRHQQAPEEHPLQGDGRRAQGRRRVPRALVRRVRCAPVHRRARRRAGQGEGASARSKCAVRSTQPA